MGIKIMTFEPLNVYSESKYTEKVSLVSKIMI